MKTADLTGALLNFWASRAVEAWTWAHEIFPTMTLDSSFKDVQLLTFDNGATVCQLVPNNPFRQDFQIFHPSELWEHGGKFIDRHIIDLHHRGKYAQPGSEWSSRTGSGNPYGLGPTPLVAALRAIVACTYGESVPDITPA